MYRALSRHLSRSLLAALLLGQLLTLPTSSVVHAAGNVQYVFSYTDSPGALTDCRDIATGCSLRDALNAAADGDTIQFAHSTPWPITYTLTHGTLTVSHSVTIEGPGATNLIIDGNNANRVFAITAGTVEMDGVTIAHGQASDQGAGINETGGSLTLNNCVVTANAVTGVSGGVDGANDGIGGSGSFGGGIANIGGTLTILNSIVTGNSAVGGNGGSGAATGGGGGGGFGGAVYAKGGAVTVIGSTLSGNTATGGNGGNGEAGGGGGAGLGAALFSDGSAIHVTNSTFSGNTATGGRGGDNHNGSSGGTGTNGNFGNGGTGGTLSGGNGGFGGGGGGTLNGGGNGGFGGGGGASNRGSSGGYRAGNGGYATNPGGGGGAGIGGAIFSYDTGATLALTTTTLSGNTTAGGSGGNSGTVGSGSGDASGIYSTSGLHGDPTTTNPPNLDTTLVAKNTAAVNPDLDGAFATASVHSLIGDGTGMTGIANGANSNQVGTSAAPIDPRIGALGNYGGSTQTIALLPGSPAIDGGGASCPAGVSTDERGIARLQGGVCDIGAFESQGFTLTITGGNKQSASPTFTFTQPLQVSVASSHGEPVQGGGVTFTAPPSGASATFTGNPATLDATGNASVTATANGTAGSYMVTAAASGAASANFSLVNGKVTLSPTTLPNGALNAAYAETITASGGTAPYSYAVTAGTLPPGLALDPTSGALSGTPTTVGADTFTVTATDASTFMGSQAYSVTITGTQGAATYTVGTTSDTAPAGSTVDCLSPTNTTCRLRDAIQYATSGTDTIIFKSGIGPAITLANGTLTLTASVTITGPGANALAVDGGCSGCDPGGTPSGGTRVFLLNNGVTATISGLTIQHGNAPADPSPGSPLDLSGGGIFNGGGILTLSSCALANNYARKFGAGIYNRIGGTLTITGSTFSGNHTGTSGGGIYNNGTMTVVNSTFSGNSGTGGGIYNVETLTVVNSTFSSNSGQEGAGIDQHEGTIMIANTLLSGNTTSSDFANPNTLAVSDGGHNLVQSSTGFAFTATGDITGKDALLIALGNNGGPTQTQALMPGSPAIDAGDDTVCAATGNGAVNNKDQRGTTRPQGAHCDIGAYEFVPVAPSIRGLSPGSLTSAGGSVTISGTGFQTGTTVTVDDAPVTITNVAPDETALTATFPVHAAGSFPVAVTNPGGLTATTTFTYTATITAVNPDSGSVTGGSRVTISGTGFVAGVRVLFGSTAGTVTNVTPTTITVTSPQHTAGEVDVTVTMNGQSATKTNAYTFGALNPLPGPKPSGGATSNPNTLPATRPAGSPVTGSPSPLPPSR